MTMLKFKLNPCQRGFIESKCAITSLVTYLDFVTSLVGFHRESDVICFDVSCEFDLIPYIVLSAFLVVM
jgi:hypothetical protein